MVNLPIFYATIADESDGIYTMSLVENPATEKDWVCFQEEKRIEQYSIQDEEKHILCGVGMVADTPIYRRDADGFEYYIVYSKDTIRQMAEKFLSDNTIGNVDIQHNGALLPKGMVKLQEIFIVDKEKGISPNFVDVPDGSLMCTYKVENDELWEMCKNKTLNGFSLAGMFSVKQETNYNKIEKKNYMSKFKDALKKLLSEFGALETDKGTLNYEGDTLTVGDAVTNDSGEPIADGEYTANDKVYVIVDGKVAEIKDKEEEPVVEETVDETVEEVEYEEPEINEEVVEEPVADEPNEVEALKAELETVKAELEELRAKVEELLSVPVEEPIEEQFEKIEQTEHTRFASLADMISKNRR